MDEPPPPIFTLRAHKAGVTALTYVEPALLISGDETGNLTLWDQVTFKRVAAYENVCDSKILSLHVIRLTLNSCDSNVLVVQSRNDGVYLLQCDESFMNPPGEASKKSLNIVATFPTYSSLFSRGDLRTIETNKAILAYPSALESHLVTVRIVGTDGVTEISGSAARNDTDVKRRNSTIFDIILREHGPDGHYLFVGYEDGSIVAYSFGCDQTETVPELNVTGLRIEVVRVLELGLADFVSAFDLTSFNHKRTNLICGSAAKELKFIELDENLNPTVDVVKLSKPGTSVISIRPDLKLVTVGGWDNTIRLFSLKSKKFLAVFKNHTKQVSTILHVRKKNVASHGDSSSSDSLGSYLMYCASLDGTISVFDVY